MTQSSPVRASFLIALWICGCATPRLRMDDGPPPSWAPSSSGPAPAASETAPTNALPQVGTPPADWDEGFHRLVAGCPDDSQQVFDFSTALQLALAVASGAVGAGLIAERPLDATTIGIAIVGGIAEVGALTSIIVQMVSRARGNSESQMVKKTWLAAWEGADAGARVALVNDVAGRCEEASRAAWFLQRLGPPPAAPQH